MIYDFLCEILDFLYENLRFSLQIFSDFLYDFLHEP